VAELAVVKPLLGHTTKGKNMPTQLTDVDVLQQYLVGVMDRADHHADNVNDIALAIAGAIVWRKDAEAITVMTRAGDMKNVLWVKISGRRYAFSYNHRSNAIDIRKGSTRGPVIHTLTNDTAIAALRKIFESL
jgi:hypothetical protein